MKRAYSPQLATAASRPPDGDDWLHEIKYDGYRIGCEIRRGQIRLLTRSGHDWSTRFPSITEAAARLGVDDALLDGELVVIGSDGRTDFEALQQRAAGARTRGTLAYVAFDLLLLHGTNLGRQPLETRKALLAALVGRRAQSRIRYADHITGRGPAFLAEARRLGLEGIVSKRRNGLHRSGRHADWLKVRFSRRQEFVIGGFTQRAGSPHAIGSLLVGCFEARRLVCAGRVGTGFTAEGSEALLRVLAGLSRTHSPFTPPPARALARGARWVEPRLVCEVAFTEWTEDGRLRHPVFQGLRSDKPAREVVRERERD